MAMGTRKRTRQAALWVPATELPTAASHPFYARLNQLLAAHRFDDFAEKACADFYAATMGRPGLAPGIYFRLLLVGYFEGLDSERGMAWRAADSLTLRDFLGLSLSGAPLADSGGSSNFSWSQLNGGFSDGNPHATWGIVKSTLSGALESTRSAHGYELHIESGYRCPHGNANVGGKDQSRHMWGDAVDMWPIGPSWNNGTWNNLRVTALANGFTWFEPWEVDPSHLHVDQR